MKKFPKGFLTNCPFIASPFFLKCNPLLFYQYDVNMFKYMKFPMLKLCLFRTLEIISTLITDQDDKNMYKNYGLRFIIKLPVLKTVKKKVTAYVP